MEGQVHVVVTGTGWMGRGIRSVASALETLFDEATDEILLAAYSISTGADPLLSSLERSAARGSRVVALINRFTRQPLDVRERLLSLIRAYPWCTLYDFSPPEPELDLHAKVVVVDRARALVGSANFSRHGLVLNHELALVVEGPAAAEIARALDVLLANDRLVSAVPAPGPGTLRRPEPP